MPSDAGMRRQRLWYYRQAGGKYLFHKFNENGQKLAREILAKTVRTSGIVIIATGSLDGETLQITSLTEKAAQEPVAVELTGWLFDKCCSGNTAPAKHTLECLRMKSCAATGYGILVKQPAGSFTFYKFDDKGHRSAVDYIQKINKKDDIAVVIKGIWDGAVLKVIWFHEKNDRI
jgi:hypothetical protein